jgi:hypothetical protein
LLGWLREFGPEGADGSLLELAAMSDDDRLRRSIYALDSAGYRNEPVAGWDGQALWADFAAWRKVRRASRAAQRAAPTDLYAPENR